MALLTLLLILLNILTTESAGGSEWIQKAFNSHKKVLDDMGIDTNKAKRPIGQGRKPPLKRQHPLQDILDGIDDDDKSKQAPPKPLKVDDPLPPKRTLDPNNIINEADYGNNPFDNILEMGDIETQHSFQHPVDMMSQNWILIGDAVATTNFARYFI